MELRLLIAVVLGAVVGFSVQQMIGDPSSGLHDLRAQKATLAELANSVHDLERRIQEDDQSNRDILRSTRSAIESSNSRLKGIEKELGELNASVDELSSLLDPTTLALAVKQPQRSDYKAAGTTPDLPGPLPAAPGMPRMRRGLQLPGGMAMQESDSTNSKQAAFESLPAQTRELAVRIVERVKAETRQSLEQLANSDSTDRLEAMRIMRDARDRMETELRAELTDDEFDAVAAILPPSIGRK